MSKILINKLKKRMISKRGILWFLLVPMVSCFVLVVLHRGAKDIAISKPEYLELNKEIGYDRPEEFIQYFNDISAPIGQKKSGYKTGYRFKEFMQNERGLQLKNTPIKYNWVQRGPGNVGGRTRGLIVDPADKNYNTWYAGSASGGIWKTTDGGESWRSLTDDLPNLAASTLVMAKSNTDVIYAGTGEGFGGFGMVAGSGLFRSDDRGETWYQVPSTVNNDDFEFINRIIVDPQNEDIVLLATNSGIFKSIDGGNSWAAKYKKGYMIEDLVEDPEDFNIQYAGANSLGIIKSTDAGETWEIASNGIGTGFRFEVAVSKVNPNRVFTSVEAPGNQSDYYMSSDKGENWYKFREANGNNQNFLRTQGWYDNIIEPHPYDENSVYVGGVFLGQLDFSQITNRSEPQVIRVDTFNTRGFLSFVNFGGQFLGGGMSTGDQEDGEEIISSDWTSVEIRFGPDIKQKAHRFTVPEGEGAGVPAEDYAFKDYVDVPFQAWDVVNNKQLTLSFRDQERDGSFNLIERDPDDEISGREYIFVNAVEYSPDNPITDIAQQGGHVYKMLYFFWPTLPEDSTWNAEALPESRIHVEYGTFNIIDGTATTLSNNTKNSNLHVDHHELIMIPTDPANEKFTILNANDGGLGISFNEGTTWKQIVNGYITTQFYGVAKKPGANEYIGGMQDNGTWQSPSDINAISTSLYSDRLGGDGFETLWHSQYSHRILASIYNNDFYVSNDGGKSWKSSSQGINGDGPFFTKLSNSVTSPNRVFAVGSEGVFRHLNFGLGKFEWQLIPIDEGWTINDIVTNQHNVEVSLSNDSVVWAGAGMFEDPQLNIFISKDAGDSFQATKSYTEAEMGFISGIATHPTNPASSFVLFSLKDKPKILRTMDYGNSWEDISGFGDKDSSSTGFPDVVVHSLLVMPFDTNIIWAGTELGIYESTDNGKTWAYANNGLPAVSVFDMQIVDNQIVVATHGRGIWTLETTQLTNTGFKNLPEYLFSVYPNPVKNEMNIALDNTFEGNIRYFIYAMNGKMEKSGFISKNSPKMTYQLHCGDIPNGTYILKLDFKNSSYSQKIQIAR
jgi:photosystem II stability/assembly factor-like uncharacterized protein